MKLALWLWFAQWRAQPARSLTAVVAIAIGVALGLAIHLINQSALDAFGRGLAVVNGDAQLQLSSDDGQIDEAVYARVLGDRRIAQSSPVIDVEVPLADPAPDRVDAPRTLRLIGLDVFRAARVTPGLLPRPEPGEREGAESPLFADDTVFLSAAARERLGVAAGDTLRLRSGLSVVTLRVAGTVPGAAAGQALGIIDLGAMQWRFGWTGRLSRIDLRLADGASAAALRADLRRDWGDRLQLVAPDVARQRMSNLSRAYRVNLGVLSLVALFTGVFIVYATLALTVIRQRPYLALLGVLGGSRGRLAALIAGQGLILGVVGSLAGLAGGTVIAALALRTVGADLGGGYFGGIGTPLGIDAATLAGYAAGGIAAGVVGSLAPAIAVRHLPLAQALRGATPTRARRRRLVWPLALLIAGLLLTRAPAWQGLAVAAYAAIACWLVAGIGLVSPGVDLLGRLLSRANALLWRSPPLWFGARRIAAGGDTDGAALAGVVASFALATAMAVMVGSFRQSVERWLDVVLPADLYLRAGSDGAGGALDPSLQRELARLPGLARVEFIRTRKLLLDDRRPPVWLIARTVDPQDPAGRLPVTGATTPAPAGTIPLYVSEAMVDLYDFAPGRQVTLTVDGRSIDGQVVAVWRDYARQHGAIVIDASDYRRRVGDGSANEAALWLAPGTSPATLLARLHAAVPRLADTELSDAADIRRLSLRIFDRSFAVTYLLEAVAMVVGLFGVTATFAGEAVARTREFGVLRHLGATPAAIGRQLAAEGLFRLAAGIAWGLALGLAIAWVLVHRVNPQSFHWTMDLRIPWPVLARSAGVLLLVGTSGAVLAARQSMGSTPVRAVREDW